MAQFLVVIIITIFYKLLQKQKSKIRNARNSNIGTTEKKCNRERKCSFAVCQDFLKIFLKFLSYYVLNNF